jgi:predicted Zn-dependent protease
VRWLVYRQLNRFGLPKTYWAHRHLTWEQDMMGLSQFPEQSERRIGKRSWLFMAGASLALTSCAGLPTGGTAPLTPADASKPVAPMTAAERKIGSDAHKEIMAEFGGEFTGTQTAYVEQVGRKIAVQSGLSAAPTDFQVTFLNSAVNNAFALPGGYVYITRQLAALCNDEAEMAGVLGHEVGHTGARHAQGRAKKAQNYGIAGALGTILGSVLGDNGGLVGALGGLLRDYSGTAAQVATLGYSRGQEEQADDYGVAYLSRAGYDPQALSSMLYSLALQSSLEAQIAGKDARSIPEWASTHPDPARRVTRAQQVAGQYSQSGVRNRDVYLNKMNGMLYGDDPEQGMIEGQNFLFAPDKLKFTVPAGFAMQNGASVGISGNGGQAQFSGGKTTMTMEQHINAVFKGLGAGETARGATQTTTVNGIPASYSVTNITTENGQVEVVITAYQWAPGTIYHFLTLSPVGSNPFESMYRSVSRMSNAEVAAIRPRKLRVVTVKSGDTIASLSGQMAYTDLRNERFMALNGLNSTSLLKAGQKVKIVTY